ncbi:MAG: nucleotide pyrophosphohydrolase [Archaeoglobales archaeon]|jgi:NTP pyrophosphatase (non-canonical NTP hydrolase)|nr:nucleotide pyrophosphohydrolase [Archaeoglobi archaeon]NHW22775.1 nucleotide pyrophosphohydrolase [Archaeoglobales archaeon]TDA26727.1 MAG: nucleotide pyrophosphohydrolase [Archaeoglobi archaeon]TDA27866.1 MAG: nucleotide pyrophosphohydrolase [Archaeoglobi archaeon]TDA30734.1 MAG: nucleotide pyrophosphohydrolase [Archaeoglobi archaeon]
MEISEFQRMIGEIYLHRDKERGIEKTMLWIVEEVGELAEAVRKGGNVGEEIADVFAWLVSLANLYGIDVEKESLKKYPHICKRCGKKPCECDAI